MRYSFSYTTDEERQQIMLENTDLYFVEERNHVDGNKVIFSDNPNDVNPLSLEEQIAEVKAENALLKARDAGMQIDINFIYETLGG